MPQENTDTLADLRKIKLPFNVDDVSAQCHKCVRKQLKKYDKHNDDHGNSTSGRFIVPCTGIPKNYIDPKLKAIFPTKEMREAAEEACDITKWAANNLKLPNGDPWIARHYQAEVLKCTSRRKVLRIARRCLVASSPVLMADGSWKAIEDIKEGEFVASRNKKNQLISKRVTLTHDNGVKDVYEIKLSNGMSLTCTSNHPLLAFEKIEDGQRIRKTWKSLDQGLTVGTKVVVAKKYDVWGEIHNPSLGALLGYMITDGYFGQAGQTPKFTNNNIRMIEEVSLLVKELFGYDCPVRSKGKGKDIYITSGKKGSRTNSFTEMVKSLGFYGVKAKRKSIPEPLLKFDKETLMVLINRMWSGDGCVGTYPDKKTRRPELKLTSSSKELLEQLKLILYKVDITSHIKKEQRVTNKSDGKIATVYYLCITDATSIENFFTEVGLIYGKEEKSKEALACAKSKQKRRRKGSLQFRYVTIKSITPKDKQQTYDIGVDTYHNFITNGIVNHNTGKTDSVCIEICYYLFTQPGIKIVVAGPQKTHTEEIITRVRAFIAGNPMLSQMVKRDVSAPYYEILINHGKAGVSRLRGFAAGAKGGSGGLAIRGQDADRLYLEEMDYIDESAIKGAVLPLLMTSPHTALVGFSTPSGFETHYYQMCEHNPRFVEFHHNYKVLPHWREVENERSNFTEEDWTHEFLAEWGDSEAGVYKPAYIDAALQKYEYDTIVRSPTWRYCIGTDWNEKHGTEIVVLGFNRISGRFRVVESVLVPKSDFTQLAGVQRLLDLNKKWKPDFVYIDAGNGSTNYELLMRTAHDERRPGGDRETARLLTILKKYDSGASLTITDPISHEDKKVPAKPFMVSASVRLFEQNKIEISSSDNILEKQLRNYIIERYTPTKTPVFGLENASVKDHRLDALNLAIVAYQLEFNDLHTIKITTHVGAALDPRTGNKPDTREGQMISKQEHRPEDRRLTPPQESFLTQNMPGRVNLGSGTNKTNRSGWDTDRETERRAEWLQRKRSRGTVQRNRPRRSSF
jgi:intein/homing endonuclease